MGCARSRNRRTTRAVLESGSNSRLRSTFVSRMTRLVIRTQQRGELSLGQPALNGRLAYAITEGLKVDNSQPTQTRVFLRRDNDCLIARLTANHHRSSLHVIQERREVLFCISRGYKAHFSLHGSFRSL